MPERIVLGMPYEQLVLGAEEMFSIGMQQGWAFDKESHPCPQVEGWKEIGVQNGS